MPRRPARDLTVGVVVALALLIVAMTIVWTAEALNTALEFTCDAASPDFHPLVKQRECPAPFPYHPYHDPSRFLILRL